MIIPVVLALAGCGGETESTSVRHIDAHESVPARQDVVSTLPKVRSHELEPVFHRFGSDDSPHRARPVNGPERAAVDNLIRRGEFLGPYVIELVDASKVPISKEFQKEHDGKLDVVLVETAWEALADDRIMIEPALAESNVTGLYHQHIVQSDTEKKEFVVYTFTEDASDWSTGMFVHEMAHGLFEGKHDETTRLDTEAAVGAHVVETQDEVYSLSKIYNVLETPMMSIDAIVADARSGKRSPEEVLTYLTQVEQMSDEEWSAQWSDGTLKAYQEYLEQVGIPQDKIREIFYNNDFRNESRREMKETISEFRREVEMSPERLRELQEKYRITTDSDERRNVLMMATNRVFPEYGDTEEANRRETLVRQADIDAQFDEQKKEIDEVNTAVRRTRDWN